MSTAKFDPLIGGMQAGKDAQNRDRRRDDRHQLDETEGRLLYKRDTIRCDFIDISVSGCCVRIEESFAAGALATVDVILPLCGIQVRLRGITQWVSPNRLIGVRFIHHSPRTKNELASLLSGLVDEDAAEVVKEAVSCSPNIKAKGLLLSQGIVLLPQEPKALPREIAQPLSPDNSIEDEWQEAYRLRAEQDRLDALESQADQEGMADLVPKDSQGDEPESARTNAEARALQADVRAETATFSTQFPDSSTSSPIPSGDAQDGRIQNMSQEEWSATVRFLANDAQVSGILIHLSQVGCIFRMRGAYPGALDGHVEIEFQLRGLSFRIAGITQGAHDKNTAKIGFVEMSKRKQQELAQVLNELPEKSKIQFQAT